MRFLKIKIQRALEFRKQKAPFPAETSEKAEKLTPPSSQSASVLAESVSLKSDSFSTKPKVNARKSKKEENMSQRMPSLTKNMTINFGKAISSFSTSLLALPYLDPQLEKYGLAYADFVNFVMNSKDTIGSIETFRNLLVPRETDNLKAAICKKVFGYLSEVFIKYFSVNWIINGKVAHKLVYLKYRFKMLRRIQNPENFTYVTKRSRTKRQWENCLFDI